MSGPLTRDPRRLFLLIAAVAALSTSHCRAAQRAPEKKRPKPAKIAPKPAPVRILYPAAPGSFVRVIARLRPSLVNLQSPSPVAGGPGIILPRRRGRDDPFYAASPIRAHVENSLGSGVLLDRQGHVLTALHVIRYAAEIRARLHDGTVVPAKVVGRDVDAGIAVLQLQRPKSATFHRFIPATFGDSAQLKTGDWVVAMGDPFGTTPYVSAGLVSAAGSPQGMTISRPGFFSFIMTDARVNAANVGGPMINISGEVVGINMIFSENAHPLGFAVPMNMIRQVLPTLLEHGQVIRSWVGIYVKPVSAAHAQSVGLGAARGALVTEVIAGGPAALAGLRAGDILLSFDGRAVTRHQDLPFAASRTPSGKTVLVKLWRARREHVLSLRLERKPQ